MKRPGIAVQNYGGQYAPQIGKFVRATGLRRDELCLGCITGKCPTPLAQKLADEMKEKFEKRYKETGRVYERRSNK